MLPGPESPLRSTRACPALRIKQHRKVVGPGVLVQRLVARPADVRRIRRQGIGDPLPVGKERRKEQHRSGAAHRGRSMRWTRGIRRPASARPRVSAPGHRNRGGRHCADSNDTRLLGGMHQAEGDPCQNQPIRSSVRGDSGQQRRSMPKVKQTSSISWM